MSDLERTEACAEAMGLKVDFYHDELWLLTGEKGMFGEAIRYDPIHDDAQAMALLKRFNLMVNWNSPTEVWCMPMDQAKYGHLSDSPNCADVNRAIVECVAKLGERP